MAYSSRHSSWPALSWCSRHTVHACPGTIFGIALFAEPRCGWSGGRRLVTTLGTVSDLLLAIREGDYSMRGRVRPGRDPLQGLIADMNCSPTTCEAASASAPRHPASWARHSSPCIAPSSSLTTRVPGVHQRRLPVA